MTSATNRGTELFQCNIQNNNNNTNMSRIVSIVERVIAYNTEQ